MQAYRDQYARVFRGGRDVVLMGISPDAPSDLQSWAKDDDFPFLFVHDPEAMIYAAFGGDPRDNGMPGSRAVIVVDPEGRIAEVIPQFRQVDPAAYDELADAIDRVTPQPDEGD